MISGLLRFTYNEEAVNQGIIWFSGLLRSARNYGNLYRHHSFLRGIYHVLGARNDDTTKISYHNIFICKGIAIVQNR